MDTRYRTSEKLDPSEDHTGNSTGSQDKDSALEPMDQAAEKRLLWKCDVHVLPMISILYMLAFIDRINIGNARIQGLEKDLHMKGHDYNVALLVFFVPYILFEVPSNMVLRKVAPSTWLSFIMICWGRVILPPNVSNPVYANYPGIVTICMGLTKSYVGFLVCRCLLGFFEAGFFPGKNACCYRQQYNANQQQAART